MSLDVARGLVFARFRVIRTGLGSSTAAVGEADVLSGVLRALTVIQLLVMARHLLDKIRFHRTKTTKRKEENATLNHLVHLNNFCSTDDVLSESSVPLSRHVYGRAEETHDDT